MLRGAAFLCLTGSYAMSELGPLMLQGRRQAHVAKTSCEGRFGHARPCKCTMARARLEPCSDLIS